MLTFINNFNLKTKVPKKNADIHSISFGEQKDRQTMGLNIGAFNNNSIIDAQALTRVTQQILNPNKENSVDVSKLDLNKFNRVSLGTDLYSERTNSEMALKTSKAATDFDVNLSKAFSANVQYLNSVAAQSLFTARENNGKVVVPVENAAKVETTNAIKSASNIDETTNLKKDRRGANPFAFYVNTNANEDGEDFEYVDVNTFSGLNIFA